MVDSTDGEYVGGPEMEDYGDSDSDLGDFEVINDTLNDFGDGGIYGPVAATFDEFEVIPEELVPVPVPDVVRHAHRRSKNKSRFKFLKCVEGCGCGQDEGWNGQTNGLGHMDGQDVDIGSDEQTDGQGRTDRPDVDTGLDGRGRNTETGQGWTDEDIEHAGWIMMEEGRMRE